MIIHFLLKGNTISDLINKLESGSSIAAEWFIISKKIVNPVKFQVIVLNKKRSDITSTNFQVDNQAIKSISSVELLSIQIDDKLNVDQRISKICKSGSKSTKCINKAKTIS